MKFFRKAAVSAVCIYVCLCVFNYVTAEKDSENSNREDIQLHGGLFESDPSPQNYIRNGNFYSKDKGRLLTVDTSFIDPVEASIYWYDKVINEFPNTPECNQALKEKMKTIVGWTDGYGDNEEFYGLRNRDMKESVEFFNMLEETFQKLENDFPNDPHLEAYAYQVAQAYFYHIIVFRRTRPVWKSNYHQWLRKTIELADGEDTFYSHLAKMRLFGQE